MKFQEYYQILLKKSEKKLTEEYAKILWANGYSIEQALISINDLEEFEGTALNKKGLKPKL